MPIITSLQNPRVKDAARLRDRRHRRQQGRILIDGARELQRAIGAGVRMVEAFVCEPLCHGDDTQRLLPALPQSGCEILQVSQAVFEKLAFGRRSEGVLGVAEMPRPTLDHVATQLGWGGLGWGGSLTATPTISATGGWGGSLTATPTISLTATPMISSTATPAAQSARIVPLVAVLEGVEKPGNVGAVLRSADAAGVSAVILADPRTDLYNPNAIRASLGTIFTMPLCEAAGGDVLAWLREHQCTILAARVDGAVPYTEVDYRRPTAIVLGSEAEGLSPIWTGDDIRAVRLPMRGAADSLNVSVTAAILFYEALRQRSVV